MTIKQLQDELSRIKKYYQMTGEDAEVMEKAVRVIGTFNKVVYICDPDKNEKCSKIMCNKPEGCFLTTEIKYSKSADPLVFPPIYNGIISV